MQYAQMRRCRLRSCRSTRLSPLLPQLQLPLPPAYLLLSPLTPQLLRATLAGGGKKRAQCRLQHHFHGANAIKLRSLLSHVSQVPPYCYFVRDNCCIAGRRCAGMVSYASYLGDMQMMIFAYISCSMTYHWYGLNTIS